MLAATVAADAIALVPRSSDIDRFYNRIIHVELVDEPNNCRCEASPPVLEAGTRAPPGTSERQTGRESAALAAAVGKDESNNRLAPRAQ